MNQEKWFSKSGEDVAKFFETDMIKGLSSEQVEEKRSVYGTNEIVSKNKKSIAKMILEQFQDFMIIILINWGDYMKIILYNNYSENNKLDKTISKVGAD